MCEIRICKFAIQRAKNMNTNKTFQFTAAIRGYHVFRKIWEPVIEEELKCAHEVGNEYDVFSVKTCQGSGETVGHLPGEISRATKFLLDRGATVNAKLYSEHYRKSPLFQGGLEIACIISHDARDSEEPHGYGTVQRNCWKTLLRAKEWSSDWLFFRKYHWKCHCSCRSIEQEEKNGQQKTSQ